MENRNSPSWGLCGPQASPEDVREAEAIEREVRESCAGILVTEGEMASYAMDIWLERKGLKHPPRR